MRTPLAGDGTCCKTARQGTGHGERGGEVAAMCSRWLYGYGDDDDGDDDGYGDG